MTYMRKEVIGNAVLSVKTGRSRALRRYPIIGPCEKCGALKSERHHRDGNTLNNEPDNVAPLCRKCHMIEDGRLASVIEKMRQIRNIGASIAAAIRNAQTHCKRGHLLSGTNMFITSGGSRGCKECRKIHKHDYLSRIAR